MARGRGVLGVEDGVAVGSASEEEGVVLRELEAPSLHGAGRDLEPHFAWHLDPEIIGPAKRRSWLSCDRRHGRGGDLEETSLGGPRALPAARRRLREPTREGHTEDQ